MVYEYEIKSMLFGLAIGDALGVPIEFRYTRKELEENPITGYIEGRRPPGTFSDDASLSFCLVESLIFGYNIEDIKEKMVKWYKEGYWSATDYSFGIGSLTKMVLYDLSLDINAYTEEKYEFKNNGNGSLMRIAPIIWYLKDKNIQERFEIVSELSEITHGHRISKVGCIYYTEFLLQLIENKNVKEVYKNVQKLMNDNFTDIEEYSRLLKHDIWNLEKDEIESSGYIVKTLESSIYCLTTTKSYRKAVLKAVNLGGDADTIASITGAMAGLLYGYDDIPKEWIKDLVKSKDIEDLAKRFADSLQ